MTYISNLINIDILEKIKFDSGIKYTQDDITRLNNAFTHQKDTGEIEEMNDDEDD